MKGGELKGRGREGVVSGWEMAADLKGKKGGRGRDNFCDDSMLCVVTQLG